MPPENESDNESGLGALASEIDAGVEAATARLAAARDSGRNAEDEFAPEGFELPASDEEGVAEDLRDTEAERAVTGQEPEEPPARDENGRFAAKDTKAAGDAGEQPATGQPSEATIERAVRLGIPLAEAKQFPSESLLAATCGRIEGPKGEKGKDAGSPAGAGSGVEAEPDLLAEIPDLDPAVYDDKIVKAFGAMKEIARRQQATIAELRGGQDKTWLSAKLDSVKDLTRGDQAKAGALKAKFDVLKAGYKAAGQAVSDDAAFDEAAKLVLGAEVEAARRDRQAAQARGRNGRLIQRPTGRRVEAKPDAMAEVADMIDRKFAKS